MLDTTFTFCYNIDMLIIDKKTSKRTKLHIKNCVVCGLEFGCYRNTTKICSKVCKGKLNGINLSKGVIIKCIRCNNDFRATPINIKRNRKYCSRKCWNPIEKYKSISTDGYYIFSTKKVHRLIVEEYLGRKLLPTEIVHHINENKLDNRIENLQIVTRSEHNKIHSKNPTK